MEMFWRTKGKRIAAWLMIALIMATTIPFGSIRASADNTATGESGTVTITGQVMVPDDADSNGRAYAGAKVTVTYPNGDTTAVTKEVTTGNDGKFNIPIADWTLKTGDKYVVKIDPADNDKDTYDSYSEEEAVTEDQVNTKKIELGAITLKEKSVPYSVTANVETSDNSATSDAGNVAVKNNVVTAIPKEGYEITAVTVKKETADWKPDGETNDNWWNKNINASGAFVYEEFKGTGNMELVLDRKLSEKRVFPAIDIAKSSTRREDVLLSREEQEAVDIMRKALNGLKTDEAAERILDLFAKTRNNAEFVQTVRKNRYI